MIGALLAIPFTAGLSGAAVGGALATGAVAGGVLGATGGAIEAERWKDEFGLPDDFVQSAGNMVRSGDSAVLGVLRVKFFYSR